MTDAYSTGVKDFVLDRDEAIRKTIGYIESSPDDAARALELEQTTGVNSSAIAGDLEGFERRSKSQLAGDLVRNNNYIADYINSHPMAAQLSSDDYGNLDAASQKLVPLQLLRKLPFVQGIEQAGSDIYTAAKSGVSDIAAGAMRNDPEHLKNLSFLQMVGETFMNTPQIAWGAFGVANAPFAPIFNSFGRLVEALSGGHIPAHEAEKALMAIGAKPRIGALSTIAPGESAGPKGVGSIRRTMEQSAAYYGDPPETIRAMSNEQLREYLAKKTTSAVEDSEAAISDVLCH
jgi:hypothetical protein